MMRFRFPAVLAVATAALLIFAACSKDDGPLQPQPEPDYFPFNRSFVWTYKTNVLAGFGIPETTMDMKIDTLTTGNGVFHWVWLRIPGMPDWANSFAVLDSANVIYAIGDHPPETPYPLFKHKYTASEVMNETITVQGKTYKTLRYDMTVDPDGTVSWWFADGIGLVKEYSEDGITIFASDIIDGVALTELVSYTK